MLPNELKTFTKEEVEASLEWLQHHPLPQTLDLGGGYYIPDVAETVRRIASHIGRSLENPNLAGDLYLLVRIRVAVETGAHERTDEQA